MARRLAKPSRVPPALRYHGHVLAKTDLVGDFLRLLQQLLIPEWNDLVALLPLALVFGVVAPVLTLLMIAWLHHRLTRRKGKVRIAELEPVAALRDVNGDVIVGANTPFCPRHALIYPPHATTCDVDREELVVRCPVDDTLRTASQQTCRACGTKYVLGATQSAITVRRTGRPPEGGAAIA